MIGAAGCVVEHQAGNAIDLGAALGRQLHQSTESLIFPRPFGDEESLDTPPAAQCLQDRVAAVEQLAPGPRQQ